MTSKAKNKILITIPFTKTIMIFKLFTQIALCSVVFLSFSFAGDISTEDIAKKCTPSVMLIHSESKTSEAIGTGYVLSQDGLIATNFHVIEGADKLSAKSNTGGSYPVTSILATDKKRDIAILKIEAQNLQFLDLFDSDLAKPGMKVAVIGNPKGLESSISEGIVSALREVPDYGKVIQISAAISPGSSGSPVFEASGKVIGMATFKRIDGEALNFAIPSNAVNELLTEAKRVATANHGKEADSSGIYNPSSLVKGSKEQDSTVAQDSGFKLLKEMESKKNYFQMLSLAKSLVARFPESALAHRVLSDSYFYSDLFDDAIHAAQKAIDLDPDNPRGWDNLASLYEENRKPSKRSRSIIVHAIKLAPDDVKLLMQYAQSLYPANTLASLSALNHAKQLLLSKKGTDIETASYELEANVVDSYLYIKKPNEAYQAAKELAVVYSGRPKIWLSLGASAAAVKKYSEVLPALQKACSIDMSTENEGDQIYGEALLEQNRPSEAYAVFRRSYEIDPANVRTLDGLVYSIIDQPQHLSKADIDALSGYLFELKQINLEYGKSLESIAVKRVKSQQQSR